MEAADQDMSQHDGLSFVIDNNGEGEESAVVA